jgi:hypothetical protein
LLSSCFVLYFSGALDIRLKEEPIKVQTLPEKYANKIVGVLNCFDRIVITGTLPQFCYAQGMTSYLYAQHIRIFDYRQFAAPFRDQIRDNAEAIAARHDLRIEFIRKKNFRKEARIKKILAERGMEPGLVHIFSAMESCASYQPWYDKKQGKAYLKNVDGKCLHYYFYFICEELGLCYMRVPTWLPCRLQFYFNGHQLLASKLKHEAIGFTLEDNGFLNIANISRAGELAKRIDVTKLHKKLDAFASIYCPAAQSLRADYHWSLMQVEYATDIIFKRQKDLQPIYSFLLETLIHSVKPENIATFLGGKLHGNYQDEVGNNFNLRILGTRIKHHMGPVSIKMYDKFALILRIETTVNDVSFFKHYREVHHRDGTAETKYTKMRKSIYSLNALGELLLASNRRYLEFISEIETPEIGTKTLSKITKSKKDQLHRYKGFNLLSDEDSQLLRILARGEFMISGFSNKALRKLMPNKNTGQISRLLKRLRVHRLIRKIGKTYKYYLSKLGRKVVTMALKLRELYLVPKLAATSCA